MQKIPETQIEPTFTGTMVLLDDEAQVLGSIAEINTDPWMSFGITGTMGFIGDGPGRPPLSFGGPSTLLANYLRGAAWRVITGCYTEFYAEEQRDYLVFLHLRWRWFNIGRKQMYFRLTYNGVYTRTTTGVWPGSWQDTTNALPGSNERWDDSMVFVLRSFQPGTYRIQAEWFNNNQAVDQNLEMAYIAVL